MATYEHAYGTLETGRPFRGGGVSLGGYLRRDRYVRRDGTEVVETVHVASAEDDSDLHLTYPSGYDARCPCCWLNHPHSEAVHQAALEEFDARAKGENP